MTTGQIGDTPLRKDATMYSMKEACKLVNMSYETLKFYCKAGLVPNVRRDENNRRVFDDKNIAWIGALNCLRACGMGTAEMKEYLDLCLQGESSIPERKQILEAKRQILEQRMAEIQRSIDYIDAKQEFYDGVLEGRTKYYSNLIEVDDPDATMPDELAAFNEPEFPAERHLVGALR
ncbi:MerR family transcriptional regulator [Bifidobacterium lemurum]|nr:MerR family transcriptional regulator [Bifidobacterium lemurum]